jgi:steroid delta-isomerase-like uncharacterized protein
LVGLFVFSANNQMTSSETVAAYYEAFNRKDWSAMLGLLSETVRHDSNQGGSHTGKDYFARFLHHMDECYDETLTEMVILSNANVPERVACEFVVNGTYKKTDGDLPQARGQRYTLAAGAFLNVVDGQITRITTYYNLPLWISLVQ